MKRFLSYIARLSRVRLPKFVLGGLWAIGVLSIVTILRPASAFFTDYDVILRTIFGALFGAIGGLFNLLTGLFVKIITGLILPGQNSLIFGDQLKGAWQAMLDVANVVFFLALVIFAILIITRQAGYNFKKAVTALITAIVLANLSLEIVQVLIEVGDALRNVTNQIPGIGGSTTEDIKTWFDGFVFSPEFVNLTFDAGTDTGRYILLTFSVMVAQIIIAFVFFRLTFVLIERAIRLAALAIFAPIQAAISILPQKELQGLGGNWFSDVLRWVLVLPITFILIGIAKMIMPSNIEDTVTTFLQHSDTAGDLTLTGALFYIIIGLGLMVAASGVPGFLKLSISSFTSSVGGSAANLASGGWKQLKGMVGKNISTAAATTTGLAYEGMRNKWAGSWLGSKVAPRVGSLAAGQEAREKRLKAARGARELSKTLEANAMNLTIGVKIKKDYDAARKSWYDNNKKGQYGGAEYDDLAEADKEVLDREFGQSHPALKQQGAAAKKQRIQANLDDINTIREAKLGTENLSNSGETALASLDKDPTNKLAQANARGYLGALIGDANLQGRMHDPDRMAINKMLFEDENGNYHDKQGQIIDTTQEGWQKKAVRNKYGNLLKDAAYYEWTPSHPYTLQEGLEDDDDGRRRGRRPAGTATAPSGTATRTPGGRSSTQPKPTATTLVNAEKELTALQQSQAQAFRAQNKLEQSVTNSKASGFTDGDKKQLIDSLQELLGSISPDEIGKLDKVQADIDKVSTGKDTPEAKQKKINKLLGADDASRQAKRDELARLHDLRTNARTIAAKGGAEVVSAVNERMTAPSETKIEKTIQEKTIERDKIAQELNRQAADHPVAPVVTPKIQELANAKDQTGFTELISALNNGLNGVKNAIGDTGLSSSGKDGSTATMLDIKGPLQQAISANLKSIGSRTGLNESALAGIGNSSSLNKIYDTLNAMLTIARNKKKTEDNKHDLI